MKAMAFYEMYCAGGGTRYLIDCLNALPAKYSEITFVTNMKEFLREDADKVQKDVKVLKTPFLSENRVRHYFHNTSFYRTLLCRILMKICQILEPVFLYINIPFFLFQIYRKKPDIIFSFNGGYPASLATLSFSIAGYLLKIPVVLSIVSTPQKRKNMHESFMDRLVWRCCKHIMVNCKAIKKQLISLRGAPKSKIMVVYNAVSEQENDIEESSDIKKTLTIGFLSRIEVEKGVFILYETFKRLLSRYPNIKLRFIGDGSALETLKQKVEKDDLPDKISIEGYYGGCSTSVIKKFDIFVLPSFVEGLPYALLEALSCGKAVIASRVGGIPEIITDEKDGLLISPNSISACEIALEKLLSNTMEIDRLGRCAKEKSQKLFSLSHFEEQIRKELC